MPEIPLFDGDMPADAHDEAIPSGAGSAGDALATVTAQDIGDIPLDDVTSNHVECVGCGARMPFDWLIQIQPDGRQACPFDECGSDSFRIHRGPWRSPHVPDQRWDDLDQTRH